MKCSLTSAISLMIFSMLAQVTWQPVMKEISQYICPIYMESILLLNAILIFFNWVKLMSLRNACSPRDNVSRNYTNPDKILEVSWCNTGCLNYLKIK